MYGIYRYAWMIGLSTVLAIIGGLGLFFFFATKKNEGKFTGFLGWIYDLLCFKKIIIESLLKAVYLILACYFTIYGFLSLLFTNFLTGLSTMILGNIILRISYEFLMILILICKNIIEINGKLGKDDKNLSFTKPSGNEKKEENVNKYEAEEKSNATSGVNLEKETQNDTDMGEKELEFCYCDVCGSIVSANDDFCPNCGKKMN